MKLMRLKMVAILVAILALPVAAQEIVNENFESYGNDDELYAVWVPTTGNGNTDLTPIDLAYTQGILTSDTTMFPGLQGQGVDHFGAFDSNNTQVNQSAALTPASPIFPTDEQSIVVAGDIFDFGITGGNGRMSIGLRSRSATENLLELGFWNTEFEAYAYRIIIWDGSGENPNWAFFELDPGFEAIGSDLNDVTSPGDIGEYAAANGLEMWHRWQAVITPTDVTFTLDLYRDGLTNDPLDPGAVNPGVDAEVVVNAVATAAGFDSLRIGGASGITSITTAAFDNILLELAEDTVCDSPFTADFDCDGDVDGDDFLLWQGGFGTTSGAERIDGDADANGAVDGDDFLLWQAQFGSPEGAGSSAVPEPASFLLLAMALCSALARQRR